LPRSFLFRNIFLISGVAISHLLILLGLLSVQLGGETPSTQGSLIVSVLGDRSSPPSLKKAASANQISASSSKEPSSLMHTETDSSHGGLVGTSRLMAGTARQVLHNPKPHYPLASRRLREQGLVIVKVCVDEQGIVGEVGLSKSSGFQNLDQSALQALSQWRFASIASNSTDLFSQCFQTPVQFTLEG
jgi:periplasmic protein TonB